jgi:hypothetical protein
MSIGQSMKRNRLVLPSDLIWENLFVRKGIKKEMDIDKIEI